MLGHSALMVVAVEIVLAVVLGLQLIVAICAVVMEVVVVIVLVAAKELQQVAFDYWLERGCGFL